MDLGVPDPRACERFLDERGVPPHIRRHSRQVARVALELAGRIEQGGGGPLDRDLLLAAALLHDIAKADCLHSLRDHAQEGGERLRALGFPRVAALVERHVEIGSWAPAGPVTEAEVLNYSDKRVRHEQVVSLADRFLDLIERYAAGNPEIEARIRANWDDTQALERKIFRYVDTLPDDIGREGGAEEP